MRTKLLFVTLLGVLVLPRFALAQETPGIQANETPKNTITANPLALLFGGFNAEYEHASDDTTSFFIGPTFLYTGISGSSFVSLGINGGMRFFFSPTAPRGPWAGPQAGLSFVGASLHGEDFTTAGYSLGALGGYTWIFTGGLDVSLGLGVQYIHATAEGAGIRLGVRGIVPALRLSLGFAF